MRAGVPGKAGTCARRCDESIMIGERVSISGATAGSIAIMCGAEDGPRGEMSVRPVGFGPSCGDNEAGSLPSRPRNGSTVTIKHHPDPATLITCSAGSQPESLCAVVASHISLCPECSAEFRRMDAIGTTLFSQLEASPLSDADAPRLTETGAAGGEEAAVQPAPSAGPTDVPPTIAAVIGADLDALDWEHLAPGMEQFVVPLSAGARGDLRLLRLAPGTAFAEHGHHGEELSLVLRGALLDGDRRLGPGDVSDLDDDTRHCPVAAEEGECILLVASERAPEFAGPAASCPA